MISELLVKTGHTIKFSILVFLTYVNNKKEHLLLAEMKLRSTASNHLIPVWDFSRIWYFSDIQVPLLTAKESKAELSVLCLTSQIVVEGRRS